MITQITKFRCDLQEKNPQFTINDVLGAQGPLHGIQGPFDGAVGESGSGVGAYLHVPFCFHKCHYCDFFSIVDQKDRMKPFTETLIREVAAGAAVIDRPVETIFVGGGTPTMLPVSCWEPLLEAIREHLIRAGSNVEFTVEANPETVTPALARLLAAGGVNRISLGAQSFNPRHLATLERHHDPINVERSVHILRDAGIDAINLDLIFGIPGQSLSEWREDLDRALALEPDHLSCYGLMYEPNTPLTRRMRAGHVQPIDDETEADMYEATMNRLNDAGYEHYEISAWAKPGRRCAHNLLYWRNGDWWPFGPSASGHWRGLRWKNVPRVADYLDAAPWPVIVEVEIPDAQRYVSESFMMGLRLLDGMPLSRVDRLLALSDRAESIRSCIDVHRDLGLLDVRDDRVAFTRDGLMQADSVLVDLM